MGLHVSDHLAIAHSAVRAEFFADAYQYPALQDYEVAIGGPRQGRGRGRTWYSSRPWRRLRGPGGGLRWCEVRSARYCSR